MVNYFASGDTTSKKSESTWKITYGKLLLNDIDFIYRNEKHDVTVSENINYNNIHVSHVSGEINNIKVFDSKVFASVIGLKCKEQSGITVEDFNGNVKVSSTELACMNLNLKTSNSLVKGGFSFSYIQWEDYQDFINKVKIRALLVNDTKINFKRLFERTSFLRPHPGHRPA